MEAIVLAGGFGTRLKHIVSDVPKPMAPVCDIPFLEYILNQLKDNGIDKAVLAVGYMKEVIEDYFGDEFNGLKLIYSPEETPLFTGGAIKQALKYCNDENVFVINGDTYFDVNFKLMSAAFQNQGAQIMIAVKEMYDFERYGTVVFDAGRITEFVEKKPQKKGYINGGIYLINRNILDRFEGAFSFETEVMEKNVKDMYMMAFVSEGYFIDIGIPEDYARAQIEFERLK